MTSGLKGDSYEEKFKEVKMTSLEERRQRGDVIQTLKILKDQVQENHWFERYNENQGLKTRQSSNSVTSLWSKSTKKMTFLWNGKIGVWSPSRRFKYL